MSTLEARVHSVFNGSDPNSLLTNPQTYLEFDFGGIVGSKYNGITKKSDVRDRGFVKDKSFPKGQDVRNWRQWSALSIEELEEIAQRLEVPEINSTLLGANICFQGVDRFTKLPKGTIIRFPEDTVLLVEDENLPCVHPGREIAKVYSTVDPSQFVKSAMGLRGLVGVVYKPGVVRVNDVAQIQVWEPKPYSIG